MGFFDHSFLNPVNDIQQVAGVLGFGPDAPKPGPGAMQQAFNAQASENQSIAPPNPGAVQTDENNSQLTYEDHLRAASTLFTGGLGVLSQIPTAGPTLLGS